MKCAEYGNEKDETIVLLHGGGLAPWNYFEEAALLKEKYHIVLPVLDGHSGSDRAFTTIEENAREIIAYIDERFGGKVLLIGGLSLGGQILVEMLSQRRDICKFALIESALTVPMPMTAALIRPALSLSYPLIRRRWFAKLQFAALRIKPSLFEAYFSAGSAIAKENMTAFLMANAGYHIKSSLQDCRAKALVLVGGKERALMKKSAEIIRRNIPGSSLEILRGYRHGELSVNHPGLYVEKIVRLMGTADAPVDRADESAPVQIEGL